MTGHPLTRSAAAERLKRLAATLAGLKDRVGEAVAAEAGRAVADAVKDLLTVALGGRPPSPPDRRPGSGYRPGCADQDDRWDDDEFDPDDRPRSAGPDDAPPPGPGRWPVAVAAAGLVRWWSAHRLPAWVAAAVSVAAVVAALAGGPVGQAGLALLSAAADVLPLVA